MDQVLICLKKNNGNIRIDALDEKRRELVALGNAIRVSDLDSILNHLKYAKEAGASYDEIRQVVRFMIEGKNMNNVQLFRDAKKRFIISPEIQKIKTCYTDKELIDLLNAIRTGEKVSIHKCVKNAIDSGASSKDIWNVISEVVGDERLLISIIETLKLIGLIDKKFINYDTDRSQ